MKAPRGKGRWLIENTVREAAEQSAFIVVDLRKIKIEQSKCVREIKTQFEKRKQIKKLKIILRGGGVIDLGR